MFTVNTHFNFVQWKGYSLQWLQNRMKNWCYTFYLLQSVNDRFRHSLIIFVKWKIELRLYTFSEPFLSWSIYISQLKEILFVYKEITIYYFILSCDNLDLALLLVHNFNITYQTRRLLMTKGTKMSIWGPCQPLV